MAEFGSIEEIQYYEEKEIDWKITDFPSTAEDEAVQSATFSFAGSSWRFALLKQSPELLCFNLINSKPWEYSVKYNLGLKKQDSSIDQLSEGILKGDKNVFQFFFFSLPKDIERECEVTSNAFTITCTLRRESNDSDQPSVLNKPKLKELVKLDTLSENFKDLIAIKDSCDTTLLVQEKEYRAHRAVLIARSSVFAAMFLHETSEKQTGIVTIPDCDPESFEEFLKFIYCGKLEEPSPRSVLHLYETSDKYDVQELKKFCVEYLMENLTVENFCDVVIFADQHEEVNLMSAAQGFFNKNPSKILQTSEWDCLVKRHYRLSKRFVMELCSKIKIVD